MKRFLLAAAIGVAFAGTASAAPVLGTFSAIGFGSYLNNTNTPVTEVNATRLDFGCGPLGSCTVTGAGNSFGTPGTMLVTLATGSFAGVTNLTIQDVQLGGTGSPTSVTPFATPFVSFDAGSITFDFTSVSATHNTVTGTAINITGTGNYISGGTVTPGMFDLSTASTAGSPTSVTFSFTANGSAAPVPEPTSLSLLGMGLLGLLLAGTSRRIRHAA